MILLLVEGLTEVCRQVLVLAGLSLFLEVLLPGGFKKIYTVRDGSAAGGGAVKSVAGFNARFGAGG